MVERGKRLLIMDNCSIHYNARFLQLLDDNNIDHLFLPPYSPAFNPIEECFSAIKKWIHRYGMELKSLGFDDYSLVHQAFEAVTASQCLGWIHHAGYL
jgi:transposase